MADKCETLDRLILDSLAAAEAHNHSQWMAAYQAVNDHKKKCPICAGLYVGLWPGAEIVVREAANEKQ